MNSILPIIRDVFIGIIVDYIKQILIFAIAAIFGSFIVIRVNSKWKRHAQQLRDKILSLIWKRRDVSLLLALIFSFIWLISITPSKSGKTLERIQNNDELRCGVNVSLAGLGRTVQNSLEDKDATSLAKVISGDLDHYELSPTQVEGLDIDFCRAVAAAIFGSEISQSKWKAVYFKGENRLKAVKEGLVDVSFRNTSWTSERDLLGGVDFGPPNFYDQLTILIRNKHGEIDPTGGVREILSGREICVAKDTTSLSNMEKLQRDQSKNNVNFELITTKKGSSIAFAEADDAFTAFFLGECDSVASDRSQIVSKLFTRGEESDEDYLIYGDNANEVTSVELLSPVIPEGDDAWKSLISHVIFTTIYAEEIGVSQKDVKTSSIDGTKVDDFLRPEEDINYWKSLKIKNNQFPARSIIEAVGNYGEIFDRNLGKIYRNHMDNIYRPEEISSSEIYIQELRGPNRLLKNGGVLVSPPT